MAQCNRCNVELGQGGIGQEDGSILCPQCDCILQVQSLDSPSRAAWKLYAGISAGVLAVAVIVGLVLATSRSQERRSLEENSRKEAAAKEAAAEEREKQLMAKLDEMQQQSLRREEELKKEIQTRELAQKAREQELLQQVQDKLEKQQAEHALKLAEDLRQKERAAELQRQLSELDAKKREVELATRLQTAEAKNSEQQRQLQEKIDSTKRTLERNEQDRKRQEAEKKRRDDELAIDRAIDAAAAPVREVAQSQTATEVTEGVFQKAVENQYFRTVIFHNNEEYVFTCRASFPENANVVKTTVSGTEFLKVMDRSGRSYLFPTAMNGGYGGFTEVRGVGWVFTGR